MISWKTTRKSELVSDGLFDMFEPLVPALDSACPGWKTAIVHDLDGVDLVYEIGDVFIRGWDMTGAINRKKRK